MDNQKKEEEFLKIEELISIFEKNNPVSADRKFDLDAVKKTYYEMLDKVLTNADEEEDLKKWMDEHDFWKSPASTRFHGNWESGLCVHSLMVTVQALRFARTFLENFYSTPLGLAGKFEVSAEDIVVACKIISKKKIAARHKIFFNRNKNSVTFNIFYKKLANLFPQGNRRNISFKGRVLFFPQRFQGSLNRGGIFS